MSTMERKTRRGNKQQPLKIITSQFNHHEASTSPGRKRFNQVVWFIFSSLVVICAIWLALESHLLLEVPSSYDSSLEISHNITKNQDGVWWWTSEKRNSVGQLPQMTIVILTKDRFESLSRLLESLRQSKYGTDTVDLTIRFDRPKTGYQQWMNRLQEFPSALQWQQGNVRIYVADETLGLAEAWFRAWQPSSDLERAVIFEDDIEVSPEWYQWLKGAHDAYADKRHDLAAFSLSRQELVPLKTSTKTTKAFPIDEPFMYALLGSHGFSPVARVWKQFLGFVRCSQNDRFGNINIETPELITSDWYHNVFSKQSMWTQHFIYFTKHHNLYNIYQFPRNHKTLAAHWQEKGAHFDGTTRGRNYPLAQSHDVTMSFPTLLKKYDWGATLQSSDSIDSSSTSEKPWPVLVMSAAIGYPLERFEVFIGSLRKFYSGDVSLLISKDESKDVREYLHRHNVQFVETHGGSTKPLSKEWEDINRSRFSFFVSVCDATRYSLCLMTDFRDSLFQANPFKYIDRTMTLQDSIGSDPVLLLFEHRNLMNDYHYDLMRKQNCALYNQYSRFLRGTQIINGGSIIGSPLAFRQLEYYVTQKWRGCNDQVTVNVVARANLLENITTKIHIQGEGAINVVGWGGRVIQDMYGQYLNLNCMVSPVVHQYDEA